MTPLIQDFRFGRITVDGETHNKDLILLPSGVVPNWWRERGHSLSVQDLDPVFEAAPAILVIGQGAYSRMQVPQETKQALEQAGIKTVIEDTKAACESYNRLRGQNEVAAALHLTC